MRARKRAVLSLDLVELNVCPFLTVGNGVLAIHATRLSKAATPTLADAVLSRYLTFDYSDAKTANNKASTPIVRVIWPRVCRWDQHLPE